MFFHKKIAGIIAALYLLLTSAVYAQPLNNSQADSVRRLEEALGGGSAAGASQNTSAAVQAARGGTAPRWVNNPYLDYPQNRYIAAVGAAANRANAEKQAFAALAAFFGQS
ncbi:MAG: hypothetical protein LBB81_04965, partial [Treponema sp.]|nr:hypothetical protein [Treponema sp.]